MTKCIDGRTQIRGIFFYLWRKFLKIPDFVQKSSKKCNNQRAEESDPAGPKNTNKAKVQNIENDKKSASETNLSAGPENPQKAKVH